MKMIILPRVKSKLQPYTCHGSLNYNLKPQNQAKHTPVLLNPSKTQPWVVLWPVFADVALWGARKLARTLPEKRISHA